MSPRQRSFGGLRRRLIGPRRGDGGRMPRFAAHRDPVVRPVPSFMLMAALGDLSVEGEAYEQLGSRRLADGGFELCCIPFFAYGLALGDVVEADAWNGYLVGPVIRRSGNGVARIAVSVSERQDELHLVVHDLIGRLEYLCEWYAPGYVAVNLEPGRSHGELFAGLEPLRGEIEVERFLA